jgi:hypothetical protein
MSLASYRAAPPRAGRKRKRHSALCRSQLYVQGGAAEVKTGIHLGMRQSA